MKDHLEEKQPAVNQSSLTGTQPDAAVHDSSQKPEPLSRKSDFIQRHCLSPSCSAL